MVYRDLIDKCRPAAGRTVKGLSLPGAEDWVVPPLAYGGSGVAATGGGDRKFPFGLSH